MAEYPSVRMGAFLRERKEFTTIDDMEVYKRAKVQWYGKGTILRDKVSGVEIKTKKQQVVRTNEFVVAEIDAKDGSFGVTPEELDGAIVSSHYFVYEIDQSLCFPPYLEWYVRTNNLQSLVKAQGSTNYSAIRSYTVYDYEIPLPSLDEQRRIVERIEALAARIENAQSLREETNEASDKLLASTLEHLFPEDDKTGAYQYQLVSDSIIEHRQGYYESGKPPSGDIYFARITDISNDGYLNYEGMPRISVEQKILDTFKVKPNDFVFARTGGAGRFALATKELDCIFASYLIRFTFKTEYLPEFLRYFFWSPRFQKQIKGSIHGGANQNVHAEDIKKASVPIVSLDEQRRIVAYLDSVQARLASLRQLQSETQEELDALLPSVLDRAFRGEL
jgi:type I restriction enzyme S subunit